MTGASKILTVSYGTFSCTLEGFDDPFNTMKAIAEYFRDLAAGDRYFGAEPPVPDAAMLHRIAEREIHRRVEAKIQDNGVILRAGEAEDAPALPDLLRPSVVAADTMDLVAESGAESVAARLQRIRAKHNTSQTVASVTAVETAGAAHVAAVQATHYTDTDYTDTDYTEDQHAEAIADLADADTEDALFAPAASQIDIPDQIEDILDEAENDLALIDLSDQFADLPDAEDFAAARIAVAPVAQAPETAFEHDAAEAAILASLQDLLPEDSAVVAQDVVNPVDLPEDYDIADLAPEAYAPIVEAVGIDTFASDALFDDESDLDDESDDEDDMLADAEIDEPVAAGFTPSNLGNDDALLSRLVEAQPPVAKDVAKDHAVEAPAINAALAGDTDAAMLDRLAAAQPPSLIETLDQTTPDDAVDDEPQAAVPRARARVIRIRRADPAPTPSADAEPPVAAPAPAVVENTALSDEAEAALQAELAELEAEINSDIAQPAAAAPSVKLDEPRRHAPAPAEDDAVNRLMAQANSEMGDEETRRRQSAIAHLKAAVAATEADRIISGSSAPKAEERLQAYRGDLDRVVRPRRPVAEAKPDAARAEPEIPAARPTPLVLVSAQRIERAPAPTDSVAPRVVMPVRPRRASGAAATLPSAMADDSLPAHIASASFDTSAIARVMESSDQSDLEEDDILLPDEDENVFADATSFEDFADQLGASQLSDLLEAAAVYCAEVLQRPEFSRPLVMRQIASLPGHGTTSREDYLRGFGTLLRQGRIAKVKRGMFALTDRSPYLAEARNLAG